VAEGAEEKAAAGVEAAGAGKEEEEGGAVETEAEAAEGRAGRAGVLGKLWGGLVEQVVNTEASEALAAAAQEVAGSGLQMEG
jgi:hypothetical protein